MDEATILWVLGAIISLQTVVVGALGAIFWQHILHCRDIGAGVARLEEQVKRIAEDIGTHETGLRGTVHRSANAVMLLDARVERLEGR